jgi:hypothetical protein
LAVDASKGSRRLSVSQKDGSQQNGWVYPEWQISRPVNGGSRSLPVVVPFTQLPPEFTPRMDALRDWVMPHVKSNIQALGDANKIVHNYGDIYVTDNNSTFLEQIYSHMSGGARNNFANIINAPLQPSISLDIKPIEKVCLLHIGIQF